MKKRLMTMLGVTALASTGIVGFSISSAAPAEAAGCAPAVTYSAINQRCANGARHWNSGKWGTSWAPWVAMRYTSYQAVCYAGVTSYGSQAAA